MVAPREVLTVGSLCLGIAGLDLGLELAGFTTVWASEIDDTRRAWGRRNFPHTLFYGDINELLLLGSPCPVDAVVGGPPCQPASVAGQRKGADDDRWLWPEALAVVAQVRPRGCLFENPTGFITMGLDRVLSDLEGLGYAGWPLVIPACAINAPHRRERVFIVAYANEAREHQPAWGLEKGWLRPGKRSQGPVGNADPEGLSHSEQGGDGETQVRRLQGYDAAGPGCAPAPWRDAAWTMCNDGRSRRVPSLESGIRPVAHGIPGRVAEIEGYGDAVVPRLAYEVGLAFKAGLLEMLP